MTHHIQTSDVVQDIVNGAEQSVGGLVVLRLYPLPLQYSPQGLGDVEMRRIWRKIEYVESSLFPFLYALLHLGAPVHAGVVDDHYGGFSNVLENSSMKPTNLAESMFSLMVKPW